MNSAPIRRQRGLTLIETSIVLAVAAIVVGAVAPSFQQARERRHLEGVAAQMETDFAHTRSLAVARNQTLRVNFASASCYVVHTGGATDCRCSADGSASCSSGAEVLRVVQLDAGVPVTMQSNSRSIAFDAIKGTVTPTATVQVLARSGASIRNIVNIMGRVRNCSPAPGLPGYARC